MFFHNFNMDARKGRLSRQKDSKEERWSKSMIYIVLRSQNQKIVDYSVCKRVNRGSQFVHKLHFLTNLLLRRSKCSLVYQHMQLIPVQATSTYICHTYIQSSTESQLVKAGPTMSYILLVA